MTRKKTTRLTLAQINRALVRLMDGVDAHLVPPRCYFPDNLYDHVHALWTARNKRRAAARRRRS